MKRILGEATRATVILCWLLSMSARGDEIFDRMLKEAPVRLEPGFARFRKVEGTAPVTLSAVLTAPDGDAYDITSVNSPYPYLECAYHEATPDERIAGVSGRQFKIEMKLDAAKAPPGPFDAFIRIHVTHPKQKLVQVPVSGTVSAP